MATGRNIQPGRGIVATDRTPGIDFDTGAAEMWGAAERLTKSVTEALRPGLERRAAKLGQEAGVAAAEEQAAGGSGAIKRPRFAFGDLAEARENAARLSYQATIRNDFDAIEAAKRAEFSHQPEEYERAMSAVRSGFIQDSDPEYAVDVEQYANDRIQAGAASVVSNRLGVQLREENANLAGRMGSLQRQMADELTASGAPSVRYEILRNEWETVRDQRLNNPALPYSQAEADEDALELQILSKASIYTANAREVLRTEGALAATAGLSEILTDPDLGETERQVVFQKVRETVNAEINLATDQANMALTARERAMQEMDRRIEADAAAIEIGVPETGLTEDQIMAVKGPAGVAEWYRKRAEASERNRLTGSIIGLPVEEATRRAMAALEGSETTTVTDLAEPLKTPADFDAFAAAIRMVETGNNPARVSADPDGAGPAGGGAVGAMQLKPDTARAAARRLGIPYDQNRLLNDVAYNEQLGREELRHLLGRYDGNPVLAATAYHAGPGNVDGWLQPLGTVTVVEGKNVVGKGDPRTGDVSMAEWIDRIERAGNPRSAAYPRKVAAALGGGEASAEWRATQAATIVTNATEGFRTDPINFATTHRVAAPIQLGVDDVFGDPQAVSGWAQAMRGRAALGGNLADRYGVPLRHFTQGEAAAYRDRFERSPASAIQFARAATQAIGARGARDALAEIGQNSVASTAIHIADLSSGLGDERFADAAVSGLTFKAQGQTLQGEAQTELTEAMQPYRSFFRNSPSLWSAVTNSATAAALGDQQAGVIRQPDYYVQAALGRSTWQGRSYGGAAVVNGANTLLPRWLNPEYADDALEAFARAREQTNSGPVYSNDQPIPAREVARMRMVIMPNGRYRLVDRTNRVAYGRNGSPFEADLEAWRPFMRQNLGVNAVRAD